MLSNGVKSPARSCLLVQHLRHWGTAMLLPWCDTRYTALIQKARCNDKIQLLMWFPVGACSV